MGRPFLIEQGMLQSPQVFGGDSVLSIDLVGLGQTHIGTSAFLIVGDSLHRLEHIAL